MEQPIPNQVPAVERQYLEACRQLMEAENPPVNMGGEEYQLAVQKLALSSRNLFDEYKRLRTLADKPTFSLNEKLRREKWLESHPDLQWHKDRNEVLRRAASELWAAGNTNLVVAMMELCPEVFPELSLL